MGSRLKVRRKIIFDIIKLNSLYLILNLKITLLGYLMVKMRHLKAILPFFLGMIFILLTPNLFWAQGTQWPWDFMGGNFEITKNTDDNFSPSIASLDYIFPMHFIVWYKKTSSGFDIYGTRITLEGDILDKEGIPICISANDQMFPSVVWAGQHFFVVWQDKRSGNRWDIYGARVTVNGEVLDPDGIPIATGRLSYDQTSPSLSFDGENLIVVWRGEKSPTISNIYFKRISKNGEVLDEKPIPLKYSNKDQASPSVVFNGIDFLVVWQDKRAGDRWGIYGARVTPIGEILDKNSLKITDTDELIERWKPVISWNGSYYLVVWMASNEVNHWSLYSKRIGPVGEILDLMEVQLLDGDSNKGFPSVLWDGTEYLLVWQEEPEGDSKILGTCIFQEKNEFVTGKFGIGEIREISFSVRMNNNASLPAISNIQENLIIAWQAKNSEGHWQIYGQRLMRPTE